MASAPQLEAPGLIAAAKQLRNERLVRIFESFLEFRACVGRVIVQAIVTIWSFGWLYGPQPVLVKDAVSVFPISVALLAFSLVWMVLIRKRVIPQTEWLDGVGFAMNLLFIGIQTHLAFLLLISLNAFLPFISIAAVARYGRKAVLPVLAGSFVLLVLTAPPGYWISRPAYFVYAVAHSVVLPLLVARIVMAMQEVAFQALASRDAQSRFISTMNHELRTPLNAVINCSQLIDTDNMPTEQRDLMKAMTVNATALRHRVNEVLDVASIDGGRLQLVTKPLNLSDVLDTVKAVCGSAASVKGVTLGYRFNPSETPYVMGDEGRIEQVITNLVTNAIKFTPSGGTVDVLIESTRADGRWDTLVSVTDTGIGVPDDKKASIFTPFTQLSTGSNRTEGGVGLGLFIALSVSNAMDGRLTVSDNPGGGSIFRWEFSLAAAAVETSRTLDLREALRRHIETVTPMHCLVFEDMDTNRLVIGNLLSRAGHRVTFHIDGADAVERIRQANPDLVFLDLHMPGKSGWDALREAGDSITTLPPIIVLTADTRSDSIREASDAGVSGYLAKPINAHELLATIKHYAEDRHR
ncbi:ATP-binding protein [Xanthomonas campestris]|jgi:signal transduction histidine kinase/ActR/RegA family two-component response regulator|uniref:ATP-binding response regulator n=1 Tax=Xanthomonas TaxID=338 RepID=UPI001E4C8710|nr:ATP-binding protein [Xanthomonas campestris]MCC5091127.1 response regulator [Xanthomonas campestris]WDJ87407.1 response regulator [Xanthomonas campestris pv. incanae]WDJ96250.1 response regulator [Xanthomonas campestris pv. incanae]